MPARRQALRRSEERQGDRRPTSGADSLPSRVVDEEQENASSLAPAPISDPRYAAQANLRRAGAALLALQRAHGNAYVQRVLEGRGAAGAPGRVSELPPRFAERIEAAHGTGPPLDRAVREEMDGAFRPIRPSVLHDVAMVQRQEAPAAPAAAPGQNEGAAAPEQAAPGVDAEFEAASWRNEVIRPVQSAHRLLDSPTDANVRQALELLATAQRQGGATLARFSDDVAIGNLIGFSLSTLDTGFEMLRAHIELRPVEKIVAQIGRAVLNLDDVRRVILKERSATGRASGPD